MIDPQYHWWVSHCKFQIKDLALKWNDDWPPIVANQNLTEGGIFKWIMIDSPNFTNQKLTENFKFEI